MERKRRKRLGMGAFRLFRIFPFVPYPLFLCLSGERSETMKVHIPSPLLSYTNQKNDVDANGWTVAEILDDLNRQFPGLRFRMIDEQDSIRPHMKIFVNGEQVRRLDTALKSSDEVYILQALSGG
jgi:molybdopterin converting factor small subunit